MAVNTHEINLESDKFEEFRYVNYIILPSADLEPQDYILFKAVVTTGDQSVETGQFQMTQIMGVTQDPGLKDGYSLVTVAKL